MPKDKTILVAPLNWGLGHATRCIPMISALLEEGYKVIIASDGEALQLLRSSFPHVTTLELPSYRIRYARLGRWFSWKMFTQLPHIMRTMRAERKQIAQYVQKYSIDGIISDNRPGVYHSSIPSVYVTHQLKVLSGWATMFSSFVHRNLIHRFDECWVPDLSSEIKLSGILSDASHYRLPVRYIGLLSQMQVGSFSVIQDVLCVLSGPEPQRSILEEILISEFESYKGSVTIVQGLVEDTSDIRTIGSVRLIPFLNSNELETLIPQSRYVICRSGYTSLMDLLTLQKKKVFFIPTPGQKEQEYLAERMEQLVLAPYCKQSEFTADQLARVDEYRGLVLNFTTPDFNRLFCLFDGK